MPVLLEGCLTFSGSASLSESAQCHVAVHQVPGEPQSAAAHQLHLSTAASAVAAACPLAFSVRCSTVELHFDG